MKFFFTTQLGPTRFELADGSLLCKDVPIARTGMQLYKAEDLPKIIPDEDGEIVVTRSPKEVFSPESITSFEGMTVVILHPEDDDGDVLFINPANWRELAHGHIENVHQGTGDQSDLLLADLVFKTAESIQAIYAGMTQISCGYDAEYEQTAPGRANQYQIRGNHAALVPNGRAGERCSIGDSQSMTTKVKEKAQSWLTKLRHAVKTKDDATATDLLANAPDDLTGDDDDTTTPTVVIKVEGPDAATPLPGAGNPTTDEPDDIGARITALEATVAQCVEMCKKMMGGTTDAPSDEDKAEEKKMTGDAGYQQSVVSRAELIMPGIALPEGGKLATFKRQVLSAASKTVDGMALIEPLAGKGIDFTKMPIATVDTVFNGAAELAKARNNARQSVDALTISTKTNAIADLNKSNADFWAKKGTK